MAGRKKSEQTGKYAGVHSSTGLTRRGEVDVQKLLRDYTDSDKTLSWFRKHKPELFKEARAMYQDGSSKKDKTLWPVLDKTTNQLSRCSGMTPKEVVASMRVARLWRFVGEKERMKDAHKLKDIIDKYAMCSEDEIGDILLGYPTANYIPMDATAS